jgi:two-component system chemotaxis response regulator CheY
VAHILAVDDSRSVIKMVEFALKSRGYAVTTAEDGEAALAALRQTAFDLLVLDINMPCLDGLALLQIIRAKDEWRALPVVMLTTEGQEADRDRALALGATAYMTKPFKPSDLLDRVARLLP